MKLPTMNCFSKLCKDFDIEYLWYDKICIDQTNKAEKQREIKQMHLIYSNARYTVALVPEIEIDDDPDNFDRIDWLAGRSTKAKFTAIVQTLESLWWKRSWTLEEVMMSTQILIVGQNTHFWSLANFKHGDESKENDFMSEILGFAERKMKSANQVLHYAHFRTSTKEHDKIYALANIFHDTIDIDISYNIDVSTVISQFYRQLAQKDLSTMCFGSTLFPTRKHEYYVSTMDCYDLPSWTGVAGLHTGLPIADITLDHNCDYMIDDNMRLHIKCRSYTISRFTKYKDHGVFINDGRAKKAGKNSSKVITSIDDFNGVESEALDWSQWCMFRAAKAFATHYHRPDDNAPFLSPILPLSLTEECDECVILGAVFESVLGTATTDCVFAGYDHNYLSPVARKSADGSSYRIIGVILLKKFQYDEPRLTSQEYMDRIFDSLGSETQGFCIE